MYTDVKLQQSFIPGFIGWTQYFEGPPDPMSWVWFGYHGHYPEDTANPIRSHTLIHTQDSLRAESIVKALFKTCRGSGFLSGGSTYKLLTSTCSHNMAAGEYPCKVCYYVPIGGFGIQKTPASEVFLFGWFCFLSLKLSNPVLKPLRTYPTETLQYAKTYAENHWGLIGN